MKQGLRAPRWRDPGFSRPFLATLVMVIIVIIVIIDSFGKESKPGTQRALRVIFGRALAPGPVGCVPALTSAPSSCVSGGLLEALASSSLEWTNESKSVCFLGLWGR